MARKKPKLVSVSGLKVTLNNPNAYTLKQKQYYKKPSAVKREKKNLAKLRKKYRNDD